MAGASCPYKAQSCDVSGTGSVNGCEHSSQHLDRAGYRFAASPWTDNKNRQPDLMALAKTHAAHQSVAAIQGLASFLGVGYQIAVTPCERYILRAHCPGDGIWACRLVM